MRVVDARDIATVVSAWTGIPVSNMLQTETEKLLNMEDVLRQRIVGQEQAIEAVSDAIRRARSGLKDPAGRSAPSFSWGRPAWARPNWRRRWPALCSTTTTRCCAST
jgi:hypothetical protein